jgi:hypothetical protein
MSVYNGWKPFRTSILMECIDFTDPDGEFWVLDDKIRVQLRMVISCNEIDFTIGKPLRTWIMDEVFPSGTITHTNILARLEQEVPGP